MNYEQTSINEGSDELVQTILQRINDGDVNREVPEDRLRRIIEAAADRESDSDGNTVPLSQPPSTERQSRGYPNRYTTIRDVAYLSDKEFARLLGALFEWFSGRSVRPAENDNAVLDLYWNRQHTTVGFRTVANTDNGLVSEETVRAVVNGEVKLSGRRSPSTVAVVTNTDFTPSAEEAAAKGGLELFAGEYAATWFRQVRLPVEVTGIILEEGENHDGDIQDLVDLPPAPAYASNIDPLAMEATIKTETTDGSKRATEPTMDRSDEKEIPVDEDLPEPGATGTLYANPRDDGDYGAFERFVDGVETSNNEQ